MTVSIHVRVFVAGLVGAVVLVTIGWLVVDTWQWRRDQLTPMVSIRGPRSGRRGALDSVPVQVRPLVVYTITGQAAATFSISTIPGGAQTLTQVTTTALASLRQQAGSAHVLAKKNIRTAPAQPTVVATTGGDRQVVSIFHVGGVTYRLAALVPAAMSNGIVHSVIQSMRQFRVKA